MLVTLLIGFLTFIIAAALFGIGGGLLVALPVALIVNLANRLSALEQRLQYEPDALRRRVEELERRLLKTAPAARTAAASDDTAAPTQTPAAPVEPAPAPVAARAATPAPAPEPAPDTDAWAQPPAAANADWKAARPAWAERLGDAVRGFFLGGNPVVRIGMVVLFFGVAFLVKYAAERNIVPIELRLSAIAVGALALLAVGWKLRTRAGHYGLVLQGGGVGVLFLTVYGAAKIYGLIPVGLSFLIMIALVALSGLLAILQNARSLAVFGSAGGFLAPVLASTGGGSHVMLFSYYALLNAGILGIAWFKSWRILNLLGFVFTFVIATAWGYQFYRPEHFATTEPFLVLFFVFYVAIAILFAQRQPPQLKGYVDGSLVFGVPIVAFALQRPLVRDLEYGLAFSALALAAFYILVASALWKRSRPGMRLLTEAFLALGIVFATLAVPLAVDGRWTAAAWALEGAALIWVGIHQRRLLARVAGLLLQLGAGSAFFVATHDPVGTTPFWNGAYLGSVVIALGALFSALQMERHTGQLQPRERLLTLPLLIWGLLWWLGAGVREIDLHLAHAHAPAALLGLFALTAVAGDALARSLNWSLLRRCLIGYAPLLLVGLAATLAHGSHPLRQWSWLAWPVALGVHLHLLRRCESAWPRPLLEFWHSLGLWLSVALLTWELAWRTQGWVPESVTWSQVAWLLVPAIALGSLVKFGPRNTWPVGRFETAYRVVGAAPLAVYLLLWLVRAMAEAGAAAPLPYLPILNPLGLGQLAALLVVLQWQQSLRAAARPPVNTDWSGLLTWALLAGSFLWLNAEIARGVHFLADVPYRASALFGSQIFQTAVSILWTVTALLVMTLAARRERRDAWVVGAALLAVVVGKLFLVDLAGIGTVARIVSFLVVGGLMLVIGYFSPIPPRRPDEAPA